MGKEAMSGPYAALLFEKEQFAKRGNCSAQRTAPPWWLAVLWVKVVFVK